MTDWREIQERPPQGARAVLDAAREFIEKNPAHHIVGGVEYERYAVNMVAGNDYAPALALLDEHGSIEAALASFQDRNADG